MALCILTVEHFKMNSDTFRATWKIVRRFVSMAMFNK